MPALEVKVKQVNLTYWLLQQKYAAGGSIKYNEIFHLYSPLEDWLMRQGLNLFYYLFFLLQ